MLKKYNKILQQLPCFLGKLHSSKSRKSNNKNINSNMDFFSGNSKHTVNIVNKNNYQKYFIIYLVY